MSYCLNPACPNPENPEHTDICQACGTKVRLRDRYRATTPLGQGGFGATFLAIDELLPGQPSCVIKQLRPTATAPHVFQMARDLFEREAKTLGKIGNHPQVPRLLDYFEDNQQFYMVQEYVSGSTLQQEVKQNGPFSEEGVKQFLSELLPVLHYIHSQQVIHRDIKPANLIRRLEDKKLVLIDFGAVKNQVNQTASSASEQTALTAYAIGTPGFAPPEQMAMRPVYASDIYAAGITCIYLLTAKSPKDLDYNPSTGEMLWEKHIRVSPHFVEVLKKMLEVSVRHRYQSSNEVLRALELEPYMDSLAQGLVSPASGISQPQASRLGLISGGSAAGASGGSAGSANQSRAAMAIRARRTRLEGTDINSGIAGSRSGMGRTGGNTGQSSGSNGNKAKVPRKLDSQEVQSAYNKGRRDFAQQNLSLLNLQKANLSEAIFHQARLNKTNLQGSNLFQTDFGRASLNYAILKDANLGRAYLSYADLEGADLRGADLSYAHLSNANLRGANLCGANLTGARITEEQLAMAKTNWMTVRPSGKRGLW